MLQDLQLTCRDCGAPFVFTARDQEFFAAQNPAWGSPVRCKPCRAAKKERNAHRQPKPNLEERNKKLRDNEVLNEINQEAAFS